MVLLTVKKYKYYIYSNTVLKNVILNYTSETTGFNFDNY